MTTPLTCNRSTCDLTRQRTATYSSNFHFVFHHNCHLYTYYSSIYIVYIQYIHCIVVVGKRTGVQGGLGGWLYDGSRGNLKSSTTVVVVVVSDSIIVHYYSYTARTIYLYVCDLLACGDGTISPISLRRWRTQRREATDAASAVEAGRLPRIRNNNRQLLVIIINNYYNSNTI